MKKLSIFLPLSAVLIILISCFSLPGFSQTNDYKEVNKKTKVRENEQAPDFKIADVYGRPISMSSLKGKKVLLTFFRNAGCPVCNLRFHSLEDQSGFFKSNNMVFVAIYASQKDNMLKYIRSSYPDSSTLYPLMVANPDRSLYKLYHIERSTGKLINSLMFHGGLSNVKNGKKLFKDKIKDDSPINMINSDFLIDEKGKVVTAYYGKYAGDFIPIADIKKFALNN